MDHIIMGIIVLLIALGFMRLGYELAGKLHDRLNALACHALVSSTICLGAYLGWISGLFFVDALPPTNYSIELWTIRSLTVVSLYTFLYASRRNFRSK